MMMIPTFSVLKPNDKSKDLRSKEIVDDYIKIISRSTNEILTKENEIKFVWSYYTEIRNVYMHAGGRLTERFTNNMSKLLQDNVHEISCIMNSKSMLMELLTFCEEDDASEFFCNPVGDIIECKSQLINFFRNYIIIIIESLNLALLNKEQY